MADDPRGREIPEDIFDDEDDAAADPQTGEIDLASNYLPERLYILPLRQRPFFPGTVFPFHTKDPLFAHTVAAVQKTQHKMIGFLMVRRPVKFDDEPLNMNDVYGVGTVGQVLKAGESEDGGYQMLVQVVARMKVVDFFREPPVYAATVSYPRVEMEGQSTEVRAHTIALIQAIRDIVRHNPLFQEELRNLMSSTSINDPGRLADFSAALTSAEPEELQEILETFPLLDRLRRSLLLLKKELEINELKERINRQIQEKITKQQREYFLREQLKAIKKELGLEKDEKSAQLETYKARLAELKVPDDIRAVIEEEISKFSLLETHSAEFGVVRNYLEWLLGLPWGLETQDNLSPSKAAEILDRDHFGLDDVKKRIIEFIAVARMKGTLSGSIICLVGPPGVGKTSIGKAVAEALGRKFFRFSLGGMRDEAEIKGHRRTYVGAMPGKVIQAMKIVGSHNPVIMLDEVDKIGASFQGDPASALLEVLDPEQNYSFRDHYLDVPYDLTKVLFIATANVLDTIPAPLLDRMEVIRLSGYLQDEKVQIARRHIVPKQLAFHNINKATLKFTDAALRKIITFYAKEAGVRTMEKMITAVIRKVAVESDGKITNPVTVGVDDVQKYLGKPRFPESAIWKKLEPGVVMGLAWTPLGGATLYVEARSVPSKSPGFRQTGQLGNVMLESSAIAYSFIKASAAKYKADPEFLDAHMVHLHVPAGATPKDGPSAGVTMAATLLSLIKGLPVRKKLAMTGELTLTGRVLPVGGIKEKLIAARKNGVNLVFLPSENLSDIDDIPENIRKGMELVLVSHFDEIAARLFENGETREEAR